jgi:transposase
MAGKPIDMNKLRIVLKLYTQGKSKGFISDYLRLSRNTVKKYIKQFVALKITFEDLAQMDDSQLEELFIKAQTLDVSPRLKALYAFFPYVEKELKKTGVTKMLLWSEYNEKHPDGVQSTQFGEHYNRWNKSINVKPVMHMVHKAGDKMFVDYAGKTLQLVDKQSGEVIQVQFFVAILGASQLTYAEATMSQNKEDFITSVENAMYYYQGVPQAIVPDNLKSAVTKSNRYEPTLNETFFDIESLNRAIWQGLTKHNQAKFTGKAYSRKDLFEEIEIHKLSLLPQQRYEIKHQAIATVMQNGHVLLSEDKHYYSVPYGYIRKKVKLLYNSKTVEIYHKYNRIAVHARTKSRYNYTTIKEHLATTHQFMTEWTPQRFINWAGSIDEHVKLLIINILEKKQHPEQAYKSCMGILSLTKKVGKGRLINACTRALEYGIYNYKIVQNILEKGLDKMEQNNDEQQDLPKHDNIRGKKYYQ